MSLARSAMRLSPARQDAASAAFLTTKILVTPRIMSGKSYSTPSRPSSSQMSIGNEANRTQDASGLTWDRYLNLRKQRRLSGVITTVPTTLLAATTAGSYFLTQEIDPSQSIAGIDPVYVYALLTLSCTGLGYLVGPTLGSSIWSLFHRRSAKAIEMKDKDFYEHISRNRVDPSRQTIQNRLPDHYGEKIGSIKQYRKWLRDQSTFRRKAAHGVDDDERNI